MMDYIRNNNEHYKVVKFTPEMWEFYKEGLMVLEKDAFQDPDLQMDEQETFDCMTDPTGYCYVAIYGNKVVGASYGNLLSETDQDAYFDGFWNPKSYRNYNEKTLYVASTAVLSSFRGLGIAKDLLYKMLVDLKENGFKYVIGHSHQGSMVKLREWFNGEIIGIFPKWYGSKQTHNLIETDLSKIPTLIPVNHIKQIKDYDCGVASMAVLSRKTQRYPELIIDADIKLREDIGFSHEDLLNFGKNKFDLILDSKYNSSIADLEKLINLGKLIIVNYQDDGEGHYSIVYGYDNNNIFIMNVWDAKEYKLNKDEFIKNWYSNMYGYRWMCYEK